MISSGPAAGVVLSNAGALKTATVPAEVVVELVHDLPPINVGGRKGA
jgi:hypothetical protein